MISTVPAGLVFKGNWNANTNTPTLASATGTVGNYYIVSVAGSTNLDGITDWQVGDWAVFTDDGAGGADQWDKIDNSSTLDGSGVAGQVAYWSTTSQLAGDTGMTFDASTDVLTVNSATSTQWTTAYNRSLTGAAVTGTTTKTLTLTQQDASTITASWTDIDSGVTGSGTTNKIPKFTSSTAIGDSIITESSGNIGIGNTSPAFNLDVSGALRASTVTLFGSEIINTVGNLVINQNVASSDFIYRNNSVEQMRIDSSGRVGINTTNPTAGLHIVNSNSIGESIALFEAAAAKNGYVYINADDNRRKSLVFQSGGVDKFSMGVGDSDELSESSFFIGTGKGGGNNADLIINSSGQVKFNNYTSSSSFPGTAAANLAVDSSGNIITDTGGGGLPTKTVNQITVANATTGTISLSVSPTNENYTDMYVSGVYQNKSTYSLSGSTITLDGGAYFPNGAIVEVVSTT